MRRRYFFFLSILFLFYTLLTTSCKTKQERVVHSSFYYWRSVFRLQPSEAGALEKLKVENLYVKFFDVVWNSEQKKAEPTASINFKQAPPATLKITPVVFITNETLQQISPSQIDTLAGNITRLLTGLAGNISQHLSNEIQIDCDWTAGTKEKYFSLLKAVKTTTFSKGKILSATIRLHQLKFISENGIPPVDKGLLMCYNMGNLRHPETANSIIDPAELKKYTRQLSVYPLKLDIALPIFDWWVWFRNEHYKGLIHSEELKSMAGHPKKIVFQNDTAINGYNFERGDWLRFENSPPESLYETARILRHKLPGDSLNIILYHLDENNLSKYSAHELESFFDSFR